MALFSTVFLCIALPYTLWCCQSLFANYRKAQKSGFPIIVCPANTSNILWMLFSVTFRTLLAQYLPSFAYDHVKAGIYGWEFICRYELFARIGSSFILVTPGKNELWVADPEVTHSILMGKNDFFQLDVATRIMGMFGPNVITSEGEDWKRHRKIVAPLLNERISESVWNESCKQAGEMLNSFIGSSQKTSIPEDERNPAGQTNATIPGIRSIAINVLGSVGYGTPKSWRQGSAKAPPGYQLSYMEAIGIVAENLVPSTFISPKILTSPVMPKSIQHIGYAVSEFPGHVKTLLEAERKSEHSAKANLMSTLVKVSDAGNSETAASQKDKLFLSENELAGNLFQFTIAGYDTTANTMAYAITLLAVHPEWQDWIREELDEKLHAKENMEYESTYPKLKRCLVLMFEVMRLYTPVQHISRETRATQVQITANSKDYTVPTNSTVYISAACLHVNPAVWGPDALSFRPTRWLSDDGSIMQPPRSSFIPWSAGPRVCPGRKMAEVEFVAVMMTIFRSYSMTPVVEPGETLEMARESLKAVMADSQPRLTLQMNKPRDVTLRWEKR